MGNCPDVTITSVPLISLRSNVCKTINRTSKEDQLLWESCNSVADILTPSNYVSNVEHFMMANTNIL